MVMIGFLILVLVAAGLIVRAHAHDGPDSGPDWNWRRVSETRGKESTKSMITILSRGTLFVLGATLLMGCGGKSADSSSPTQAGSPGSVAQTVPPSTIATTLKPVESVQEAVKRHFDQLNKGQYGRMWDEFHPLQQAFIPRDKYVGCRSTALAGIHTSLERIVETYPEPDSIPGTNVTASPSTAVTVEVTIQVGGVRDTSKVTMHEHLVEGRWRHVANDKTATAYKAGTCP